MDQNKPAPYWRGKNYSFFCNKSCEYFPCHETTDEEGLNCLFCYCPLYALGRQCGGNFSYTESGIKDCSMCLLPHRRDSYGYITGKFMEIVELMRLREEEPGER